ncbi:polysaccharide deacetylase family protein [Shimazuella kribbensis]|uniref:polysaccharide deacetylase family protein n=1 Tax=Shimazuella kribbensis TaxID=139808 RepID=UPI00048AD299|nr:polysaccharide deacetylase family protein [Shimazuella kribbensis]
MKMKMKWLWFGFFMILGISSIRLFNHPNIYADGPPHDRKYYEKHHKITWEKPTQKKWIALTFDDGPSSNVTQEILQVLQQYQAKATFFCLGYKVQRYPEIARQVVSEGHEIANHTFHHKSMNNLSKRKLESEIEMTQKVIFQTTGMQPKLFRPPEGVYTNQLIETVQKHQLQLIMWSWDQDTKDWSKKRRKSVIVNKVIKNASNGDIVLFHDTQRKTVLALKEILPELKKQGYQFVTVSQLLHAND